MKNVDIVGRWELIPLPSEPVPLPMDGWKCRLTIEVACTEPAKLEALRTFLQSVSDETGLTVVVEVMGLKGSPFMMCGTEWAVWSALTRPRLSPPFDKEDQ